MRMIQVPKSIRFIILMIIMGLGYLVWLGLLITAPKNNIIWLNNNLGFKDLILGTAGFSLFFSELSILFPELKNNTNRDNGVKK